MPTALSTGTRDQEPAEPQGAPASPVRLTVLRAGDHGSLHATSLILEEREMLRALGLAESSRFRVCKAGDPWILQVRGTRVGLSDAVARRILVIRDRRRER